MSASRNIATIVCAIGFAVMTGNSIAADRVTHRTQFKVLFGALPVGEATFEIDFDEATYSLKGHGKTVGIAEIFAPGRGHVRSLGDIAPDRVVAGRNAIVYVEKKKKSQFNMMFDRGAVKNVSYKPDTRKNKDGPNWVPIKPAQLRSVIDPASSLVVPVEPERANDPRAVCDRVLNVYDGDTRFDIALKYKSTKPIRTKGYRGFAYVCQLRYIPVSGHELKQRNVEYMSSNEDMEIWLAPMAKTNLYTPIRIVVPTWVGQVTAVSNYFGTVQN